MTGSNDEHGRPNEERPSFEEFLLAAPDLDALEINRPRDRARVVELATSVADPP